jgi:quercetin dioxygenase-like cupin family protein
MLRTLILALGMAGVAAASSTEKLRNEKVVSTEYTLKAGETATVGGETAVTVYFDDGGIEITRRGSVGKTVQKRMVQRGRVEVESSLVGELRNVGPNDLRFVRTVFRTGGLNETWGEAGLAPNYKVLIESQYARVYEIKIEAGAREPQHTHHARVVICLSGAILKHVMPDGREEPSTLETGDVVWRPASTHVGENLGKTDLRVIAIEPK